MSNQEDETREMILKAHQEGVEQAIDLSIRTGVPLVVERNGEIVKIKPRYKYIRVPIDYEEKNLES